MRAQPGWEALGFEGRAEVFKRAQKWMIDNSERVIQTIVSETGKAWEEAQLAEIAYVAGALGFWAKNAEKYLAEEKVRTASPFVKGRKLRVRYAPVGVVGVIGPWNYPLTNSFGDASRDGGGQRGDRQAERGHAALADADGGERCASAACRTASTRSPRASATQAPR